MTTATKTVPALPSAIALSDSDLEMVTQGDAILKKSPLSAMITYIFGSSRTFAADITVHNINNIGTLIVQSNNGEALAVGANGATNPAFSVDASSSSQADGLAVVAGALGSGVNVKSLSGGTNAPISFNAQGSGTIAIGNVSTGPVTIFGSSLSEQSSSSSAFTVGQNGAANPAFQVDASASSQADGLKVTAASVGFGVDIAARSSGTNAPLSLNAQGTGAIAIGNVSTGVVTVGGASLVTKSGSSSAFTVGPNGATNPAFQVDGSLTNQADGLKVVGQAAGGGVNLAARSGSTNAPISLNAQGSGSIAIGNVSTGTVTITPNVTHSGTTTFSGSVTYGGVTFANSVTGSGSLVGSVSPTFTGTPVLGAATATSINKVAITQPATGSTLTIPDGVTLTGPASSGTTMTLGNAETVSGAKTFNSAKLLLAGSSTGSTTLNAAATASGTLTLPAATDTLVGRATTDTLTNKTLTAPSIDVLTATATHGHNIGASSPGSGWGLYHGGTITASLGFAINWQTDALLTAAANGDTLQGLRISCKVVKGAFTGVVAYGLYIQGQASIPFDWGIRVDDTSPSWLGGTLQVVGKLGYATGGGAGGSVTQITSRTTGVTLNTVTGAITLLTAAGSTTPATFTVTNSQVAATDTISVSQKSGANLYQALVTAVAAGSFNLTIFTTGGTTSEAPVFNFNVIRGATN